VQPAIEDPHELLVVGAVIAEDEALEVVRDHLIADLADPLDVPRQAHRLAQLVPVSPTARPEVAVRHRRGRRRRRLHGTGDANILRFTGVEPGDEVLVDNRKFLAYCYYARHHVIDDEPAFAHLPLEGSPLYPQHPVPRMSSLMGVCYFGSCQGKVLWIHHPHDSSVWPAWGTLYHRAVRQAQGETGARGNFRIRWTEYAEHGLYGMVPAEPNRVAATRLIDFRGITEQSMMDLIDGAENGVEPSGTTYAYADGQMRLPSIAAERGRIQPVASATDNGGARQR
jgi:hypothetical protein